MFTLKFEGLSIEDAETPYFYGSLPAQPVLGQILTFDGSENRYVIYRIDGEPLVGEASASQQELAWTEIGSGKAVPTLWLQKLEKVQVKASGRSFDYEEVKQSSQKNREMRLSASSRP